jgi:energy-converting hydrogenase Eha subunit E
MFRLLQAGKWFWNQPACSRVTGQATGAAMIILGVILLILGFLFHVSILWTIGIILIVIGAVLWLLGSMGRAIGPRRHYW